MHTGPKTLVANWDGIFQPRSASPRQHLAAIYSFAELYTYQWQGWITSLPGLLQSKARAAMAAVYVPKVISLYRNKELQKLIEQLKTAAISEHAFFTQLRDTYFSFLNDVPNLEIEPLQLVKNAWLYPRIQDLTERELNR